MKITAISPWFGSKRKLAPRIIEQHGLLAEYDDHARLHAELSRFENARVVVSYYDHPRIRQLYEGWSFIDCATQKNLHMQNRRGVGKCEAPEVLIVNGAPYTSNRVEEVEAVA